MLFGNITMGQSSKKMSNEKPEWHDVNEQLIKKYSIKDRTREDIPDTKVISNVGYGKVINIMSIPSIKLSEGVMAKAYWGKGTLMSFISLEPNSSIPARTLSEERFMFVLKGEVTELIDGKYVTMKATERESPDGTHGAVARRDFIYLQKGSVSSINAGKEGAKILEVYSPVPSYYLEKSGSINIPPEISLDEFPLKPSVEPNKVYDLYNIQYSELVPGSNSRLISGKGVMMSFIRMDPGTRFAYHNHPEEQVMIVLRGWVDENILDKTTRMEEGDIVRLPGRYVHGGELGPYGCDVLDVFFPPRIDYNAFREVRQSEFNAIIPADSKIKLVIDGANSKPGLTFTEGPKWVNGKLYFSNIHFDQAFNGDPNKSSLVEMSENGDYRNVIQNKMLTNGIMSAGNGNLIVCDMFGHRVIEMDTSGNVLKVLADSYNSKPLDGPNDLVMDAKGGIYFTDPQFTPETKKNQPGRTVYYLNPKGKLIRIINPDDFAMPNGIVLSPDGKTLYIANTYDDEKWWNVNSNKDNFIWAYDVKDDGTITNERKFAELHLIAEVLDRKSKSSGADGMTIDDFGNLYVATYAGIQIFNSKGKFIGIINFPTYPVNCAFGGKDFKTLYVASHNNIYSIRTNVKGFMLRN